MNAVVVPNTTEQIHQMLGGGGGKLQKFLGLSALGAGIAMQIVVGSKIWDDFNQGKAQVEKRAPSILMIGIIVVAALAVFITLPVWTKLLLGIGRLGGVRLISAGALIGLLILGISLRARYVGGLVMVDEDTARCPDGSTISRPRTSGEFNARNSCDLDVAYCPGVTGLTVDSVRSMVESANGDENALLGMLDDAAAALYAILVLAPIAWVLAG